MAIWSRLTVTAQVAYPHARRRLVGRRLSEVGGIHEIGLGAVTSVRADIYGDVACRPVGGRHARRSGRTICIKSTHDHEYEDTAHDGTYYMGDSVEKAGSCNDMNVTYSNKGTVRLVGSARKRLDGHDGTGRESDAQWLVIFLQHLGVLIRRSDSKFLHTVR